MYASLDWLVKIMNICHDIYLELELCYDMGEFYGLDASLHHHYVA